MNTEIKAWIDALRSGKYEQGKGWLCKNRKYCCLGVRAEIDARVNFVNSSLGDNRKEISDEDFIAPAFPSPNVLKLWGLDLNLAHQLADMNDGSYKTRKHSFLEIADFLEKHYS